MREILDDIERWRAAGTPRRGRPRRQHRRLRARAIRARRWRSAKTAKSPARVSGGCVEGAVVGEALGDPAAATHEPRLVTFGYSDDEAFAVGLTCGGTIHLFIEPLDW